MPLVGIATKVCGYERFASILRGDSLALCTSAGFFDELGGLLDKRAVAGDREAAGQSAGENRPQTLQSGLNFDAGGPRALQLPAAMLFLIRKVGRILILRGK